MLFLQVNEKIFLVPLKMIMSPLYNFSEIFVLVGPPPLYTFQVNFILPFLIVNFRDTQPGNFEWLFMGQIWVFLGLPFVPEDPWEGLCRKLLS